MKKCIIVCWFGKLPDYYKHWEKSASFNKSYDFLVFSDQDYISEYKNVIFIKKSLEEINKDFSDALNIKIDIKKPYKFCDFRPAYGILFKKYLENYDFWGHCDFDQIFGDLDKFVTDEILEKAEKVNFNGHFTLYKNIENINVLYKKNGGKFNYKEVFLSDENFAFDEFSGIKLIAENNNVKNIYINDFCDIDVKYEIYTCVNSKKNNYQIYSWENGKLFKYIYKGNELKKYEKMYLHFQKKKPLIKIDTSSKKYIICKNGFIKYPQNGIDKKFIEENNGKFDNITKYWGYVKYFFKKMNQFIHSSNSKKKIWIKQKLK